MLTGFAVSGVLWPSAAAAVAERYGWRAAAALLPIATLLVALPIAVCVLREGPHRGGAARAAPAWSDDAEMSDLSTIAARCERAASAEAAAGEPASPAASAQPARRAPCVPSRTGLATFRALCRVSRCAAPTRCAISQRQLRLKRRRGHSD